MKFLDDWLLLVAISGAAIGSGIAADSIARLGDGSRAALWVVITGVWCLSFGIHLLRIVRDWRDARTNAKRANDGQ